MRRQITTSLLAAVLATSVTAPTSAQLAGFTIVEPEVIDPGVEPRQELRYRFAEGHAGTMVMDLTMDVVTIMDGVPMDEVAGSVSIRAELATNVTDVYEDGSARIEQVFTGYAFGETGDATADAELQAMSDQFEGITVWQVLDDRGAVLEVGADAFADLPLDMQRQVLESTYSVQPFPEEAVGEGARWVASGSMSSQGLPISMSVENEVLELSDEGVVLDMAIAADVPGATDLLGDMLAEVTATIDRFEMTGGGTMEVAFDTLIPTSQADIDMDMEMSIETGEGDDAFAYSVAFDMLMGMDIYPLE